MNIMKYKQTSSILLSLGIIMSISTGCGGSSPYDVDTGLIFAPTMYDSDGLEIPAYTVTVIYDATDHYTYNEDLLISYAGKPKTINTYENSISYEYKNMEFELVNGKVSNFRYWFDEPMMYTDFNDIYKMFGLTYTDDVIVTYFNSNTACKNENIGTGISSFEIYNINKEASTFESVYIAFDNSISLLQAGSDTDTEVEDTELEEIIETIEEMPEISDENVGI